MQFNNHKTELLFSHAIGLIDYIVGASTPVLYVQHMAETVYTQEQRYERVKFDFTALYHNQIRDLHTIIRLNESDETKDQILSAGSNANQIAAARILKAYYYHYMTDRWGYLPYREAFHPEKGHSPAYDSQEFIYHDLIKELKEAIYQMDNGDGIKYDILFSGDM